MNDVKPGDIFMVKIDDVEYETLIDPQGVQRFKEKPDHFLVKQLRPPDGTGTLDLNQMAVRYMNSQEMRRDYMEMHMAIGYSVCRFNDIFGRSKIVNPLWGDGVTENYLHGQLADGKLRLTEFLYRLKDMNEFETDLETEQYFVKNFVLPLY